MTDLTPDVRDRAAEAARQAWVTAICVKPYVPGSGYLAVVDAVVSVVAPEIARQLKAQLELHKIAHEGLSVTNLQLRARIAELEAVEKAAAALVRHADALLYADGEIGELLDALLDALNGGES